MSREGWYRGAFDAERGVPRDPTKGDPDYLRGYADRLRGATKPEKRPDPYGAQLAVAFIAGVLFMLVFTLAFELL
jgi:hypothetical protein